MSARIRGAKTELEELGEEVVSISKIREEVMALSGVDVMLDADTFKSTYQILDELSVKWKDLTDIQRASLTEILGGKRQANVISALMNNFDIARDSLETSLDSEGSAMEEHAKWMESLEAKINILKAAWEELSEAFLDDKFLGKLIDTGTDLLNLLTKIVDTIGSFPTLALAVGAALSFKNIGRTKMFVL